MRKIILIGFLLSTLFISMGIVRIPVRADELEDINSKLATLNATLESSEKATQINEKQLTSLTAQLTSIKNQVLKIEQDITKKEKEIQVGEEKLITQKKILDERVASFYKQKGKTNDAVLQILVSDNLSKFLKQFTYQQNLLNNDRATIVRVVLLVQDIEEKKATLEDEKVRLVPIKEKIDEQSAFLEGEVLSAKKYENTIKSEIASLSARQQEIVRAKQASLNLPVSLGAGPMICTDDRNRNPGFGNAFAFYTFGIPHRIGMSQYGAYGRAKAGQNYEDILRAYYNFDSIEKRDATINVEGYQGYSLDEYTKRIYEVPASWTENDSAALKAQAIAIRSYALAYTKNGTGSICTTQQCQVFKPDPKTDNNNAWINAVDATAGLVMVQGGNPITAWFASTAGGYTFPNNEVWGGSQRPWTKYLQDGSGGYGSFQDVINNAYDKESPCMYAAQGWRAAYDNSAWLKSEEVADIVNVILLAKKLSSEDTDHLYQPDKPNPTGKETWDFGRVKSELQSRGGNPLNSVNSVSVSADFGSGQATSVSISGDTGTHSFSASEFRDWFNLRAPANLQIVGPLFNVERQ
ncbi:MAG: SpoIID/LytB domain-containing protein [Candidatus Roizmanbacteria bacterium]|nr:SpoIID/LytB domain-containing protein [Candidatus Roizmanbacteria bacterium]